MSASGFYVIVAAMSSRAELGLLSFLLGHLLVGIVIGWTLLAGLLLLDIHGLGSLVLTSDAPVFVIGLMMFLFALTFGSLAMGTAVMLEGRR
ncbi:MAG: hypothetical protein HKO62_12795 [Gammaproteobacteria bacterium]|nr:hypothetical protein [Gammaproteobacteria bacterium]